MKNISGTNLIILIGIATVVLYILNPSIFIFNIVPFLVMWYVSTVYGYKKEEKCRLYRWIVAGVLLHPFMSGWGVWRATGNIFGGLLAILMVFLFISIISLYIQQTVLVFAFGLIPAFIILLWAWKRLPDDDKVNGWT